MLGKETIFLFFVNFLFGRSDGGSIVLLSLWQPGRAALDPAKELVFAVSVAKATDTAKRGPSGISRHQRN